MKRKIIIIALLVLVILGLFFVYFKLNNEPVQEQQQNNQEEFIVPEEEQTNEEKVSMFFEALKSGNYQQLSKNFTEQLASELTEEEMIKFRKLIFDNLGDLINLKEPEVMSASEERTLFVYYADFEKETGVMIRASFTKDGKMSTIYLDSPKLKDAVKKY
jgi:hypothetical protein